MYISLYVLSVEGLREYTYTYKELYMEYQIICSGFD